MFFLAVMEGILGILLAIIFTVFLFRCVPWMFNKVYNWIFGSEKKIDANIGLKEVQAIEDKLTRLRENKARLELLAKETEVTEELAKITALITDEENKLAEANKKLGTN